MTQKVSKRHSGAVKQKGGGRLMVEGIPMVPEKRLVPSSRLAMVWMKEKAEKILTVARIPTVPEKRLVASSRQALPMMV
jgi:hypothetical protein